MSKTPTIYTLEKNQIDGEALLKFLKILLPEAQTASFETVEKALVALRRHQPDLLILGFTGETEAKILREYAKDQRRFKVLCMARTRHEQTLPATMALLRDLGADEVVMKPFDDLVLKGAIETLLSGVFSSTFSFFGTGDNQGLGKLELCFSTRIFEMNEEGLVFSSEAFLEEGAEVKLRIDGAEIPAKVTASLRGTTQRGYRVLARFLTRDSVVDQIQVRRWIIKFNRESRKGLEPVTESKTYSMTG